MRFVENADFWEELFAFQLDKHGVTKKKGEIFSYEYKRNDGGFAGRNKRV